MATKNDEMRFFRTPTAATVYREGRYTFVFKPVRYTGHGHIGILKMDSRPEVNALRALVEKGQIDEITEEEFLELEFEGQGVSFRQAGDSTFIVREDPIIEDERSELKPVGRTKSLPVEADVLTPQKVESDAKSRKGTTRKTAKAKE